MSFSDRVGAVAGLFVVRCLHILPGHVQVHISRVWIFDTLPELARFGVHEAMWHEKTGYCVEIISCGTFLVMVLCRANTSQASGFLVLPLGRVSHAIFYSRC